MDSAPAVSTTGGDAVTETAHLIASDKVEGTPIYNRQREHLGSVHNFMVNKVTGQVAYAVMSFGGFLGMGESFHPLPWRALTYDPSQDGYVIDLDKSRLKNAPTYKTEDGPNWSDREYGNRIDAYYGMPPYWGLVI